MFSHKIAQPFELACLLSLATASACGSAYPYWAATDDFLSRLRCGSSKPDVKAIAQGYKGLELEEVSYLPPWDLAAVRGNTTIYLDFEGEGLKQVQVTWVDAILHRSELKPKNLCL